MMNAAGTTTGDGFAPPSSSVAGDGFAPRVARRPVPTIMAPVVVLLTLAYGVLAALNPIFNQSVISVLCQTTLFGMVLWFILLNPNGDMLDALKVSSVYYAMCFCIAPLFLTAPGWHFAGPIGPLAAKASGYLLAGYVLILIGYFLPVFKPLPRSIEIDPLPGNVRLVRILSLTLFGIGFVAYVVAFFYAGGVSTIIGGDEARNQWFKGVGFLLWLALFSYTGAIVYFSTQLKPGARAVWVHAWPLVIAFSCWALFQGRMRALNILIMGLLVTHYLIRPLRARHLGLFFAGGFLFSVFVGFTRHTDKRHLLLSDPVGLLSLLASDFFEFSQAMIVGSFSRHRQIMLIFDKVPDWMAYDWGATFFMFLNPPLRLVGLGHLQIPGIGPRLFKLAHPNLGVDLETGYLSSLPGEFLVNFPAMIALFLFVVYGVALRLAYERLVLRRADPCSIALYAVLVLAMSNMIFASLGQNVFEILVLTIPLVLIGMVGRLGGRPRVTAQASWSQTPSDADRLI